MVFFDMHVTTAYTPIYPSMPPAVIWFFKAYKDIPVAPPLLLLCTKLISWADPERRKDKIQEARDSADIHFLLNLPVIIRENLIIKKPEWMLTQPVTVREKDVKYRTPDGMVLQQADSELVLRGQPPTAQPDCLKIWQKAADIWHNEFAVYAPYFNASSIFFLPLVHP
jgi:hypothetical protein